MANRITVVLAHGLEGSPNGRKAEALREAGFEVVCPDGRGLVLRERLVALDEAVCSREGVVLVGSSYGGLASIYLANKRSEHLVGLVLGAPALHHCEPPVPHPDQIGVPADLPCVVVHGVGDTIVPIEVSRQLVRRCPHVVLVEVDDDHRLSRSLGTLVDSVRRVARREA